MHSSVLFKTFPPCGSQCRVCHQQVGIGPGPAYSFGNPRHGQSLTPGFYFRTWFLSRKNRRAGCSVFLLRGPGGSPDNRRHSQIPAEMKRLHQIPCSLEFGLLGLEQDQGAHEKYHLCAWLLWSLHERSLYAARGPAKEAEKPFGQRGEATMTCTMAFDVNLWVQRQAQLKCAKGTVSLKITYERLLAEAESV